MKKAILTLVAAITVSVSAFAFDGVKKTDDLDKISYNVRNQFDVTFGSVEDVTWAVTSEFQKAQFYVDDLKTTAYYNLNGEYLGYTQSVSSKLLPSSARKELAIKYKDYNITEIIRFHTENAVSSSLSRLTTGSYSDEVAYFVNLEKDGQQVLVRVSPTSSLEVVKS
ncbi:hypothetical protein [Mucilaginibacter lacusdianchii]|uniref:hypothetical protein n=1 Tax=Mucilaginibacter lacusdianchii TaxID=2684211 RepID=UPI00131B5261|nr:hypothetical protein [Mucilaginibacter sp. JXJ CY 39]